MVTSKSKVGKVFGGDMGNVQGVESPQWVYTTEYINFKTLLVQMQTIGQAVIETLTFHKHIIDQILTENERLDKSSQKKSYWSISNKNDDDSYKHHHHQMIRKALEDGGVLQIKTMFQSFQLLDSLIQTSVRQHFSESIHQSLEKTWQQVHQKEENCPSLSRREFTSRCETTDGQVYGRVGPYSPSNDGAGSSVDLTLQTSSNNVPYLNQEIRPLKNSPAEMVQEKKKYLSESNAQKKELTYVHADIKQQQINALQSKAQDLEQLLVMAENKVKSLENTITEQTADINIVRSNLSSAEVSNQKLQSELSNNKDHIKSVESEVDRLKSNLSENKKRIEQQEYEIGILKNENCALKNTAEVQLQENLRLHEQLNKKQVVDLQIWFQRTDLLTQVATEIQEQLKTKCHQTANMVVNCFTPDFQSDLKPNKPTLVLCINASRLGTDVAAALSSLQCSPDVAVVVLHHKAKHALPTQSSDRVLTSPEYKQLGGIFDMAFLAGRGIYPCELNESTLKGIVEFLKYRIFQYEHSN